MWNPFRGLRRPSGGNSGRETRLAKELERYLTWGGQVPLQQARRLTRLTLGERTQVVIRLEGAGDD